MTDDANPIRQRIAAAAREKNIPALTEAYRDLLAAHPEDIEAREHAATLAIISDRISDARAIVRGGSAHGLRVVADALIDPARAQAHEGAYVAVLNDVLVETHDWSILDGDKVYNSEAHSRRLAKSPWVDGRTSRAADHYLFKLPQPSHVIDEPCAHVGGDANYAHWVERNLLKLGLLEGTPYETWPLLVNDDLTAYQREFLALLAIPEERLVRVPRGVLVECRQLVVPTNLVYSPRITIGVEWLRRKLSACMHAGPPCGLLYLSRADARARRLSNERELEEVLGALGFESVIAGQLPVREQVRAVSAARVIVAPHGAALANLVFASRGAALLEINSVAKSHMTDFTVLAKATGLRHKLVLSEDYDLPRPAPHALDSDFRVDVAQVLTALKALEPDLFE